MNTLSFFEHWGLRENPFRAEEARHDTVFHRTDRARSAHRDFEKIVGDLNKPSTAILFGEKGSGKTAIRLQIAEQIQTHNAGNQEGRVYLLPYDDMNAALERYCASAAQLTRRKEDIQPAAAMERIRLVDHMDELLRIATVGLVDGLLEDQRASMETPVGKDELRRLRAAPASVRRDIVVLQGIYDRPDEAPMRGARLARAVRVRTGYGSRAFDLLAALGWVPAVLAAVWFWIEQKTVEFGPLTNTGAIETWGVALLAGGWAALLMVWAISWQVRRARVRRTARRIAGQTPVLNRASASFAASLAHLPRRESNAQLPTEDSFEARGVMFERLQRVLAAVGYSGVVAVVDRVDEPTFINGDADLMRAVVWPMFNNKFLQMPGVGLKLLLPIELRYALFRESSSFFQEARMDKQCLIEQLAWTGSTLYDICNTRLQICCHESQEGAISLREMFDEDVSLQDIVDALDQMRQPRDAFKMLYQCVQEHCANVTEDQPKWRIPRLVLENVRRQQADRVQQLFRGVRPA